MNTDRMTHVTILADNGGGLTLQIDDGHRRWQHSYVGAEPTHFDGSDIAADIVNYVTGAALADFERDETEEYGWAEPTEDEQRNGGYRVLRIDDVLGADPETECWGNVVDLKEALCRAVLEGQDTDELLSAAVRDTLERN